MQGSVKRGTNKKKKTEEGGGRGGGGGVRVFGLRYRYNGKRVYQGKSWVVGDLRSRRGGEEESADRRGVGRVFRDNKSMRKEAKRSVS